MKIHNTIATLALTLPILLSQPANAQTSELSERELYNLCARSPLNSRCEGLEIPIPLDFRTGTTVNCSFRLETIEQEDAHCKVALTDERLTLYYEQGDRIEFLDNRRGSQALNIFLTQISTFNLRVWDTQVDASSFLIGGRLYVLERSDRLELEREFDPATETDATTELGAEDFAEIELGFVISDGDLASNATLPNHSNILFIAASEEFGAFLRDQITPVVAIANIEPFQQQLRSPSDGAENSAALISQLLETGECVRCNLQGADLSDADLEEANLEGANLQAANLAGATLEGSYLVGANLTGATLTGADLRKANLAIASLTDANLEEANLEAASLQSADLQRTNLNNAQISGANLERANLEGASLENTDLSDVTITRDFIPFLGIQRYKFYTNLENANLRNAVLQGADLEDVALTDADLSGANLTEADLNNIDLTDLNLCGATLPDGSISNQGCP